MKTIIKTGTQYLKFATLFILCLLMLASFLTPRPVTATPSTFIDTPPLWNTTDTIEVSGAIFEDTTWAAADSPYIVTNSVLVMSGVTLTIEPGVTVKFLNELALRIDGQLIARGTSSNGITFTSNQTVPAPGDWGYIIFTDASIDATYDGYGNYTGGSILQYCSVGYGGDGENVDGVILIDAASPYIDHCSIHHSSKDGIHVNNTTDAIKIQNCNIANNECNGIYGGEGFDGTGGGATITNCTINDNNGTGIFIYSNQTVSIGSSQIERNLGGGISVTGRSGNFIISDCTVSHNSETGICAGGRVDSWANTTISNSSVCYNTAYRAAGILLGFTTGTVDNCDISNNTANAYFGGAWVAGATISMLNSNISHNFALGQGGWTGNGGGIHVDEGGPGASSLYISNCKIHHNSATGNGGGISTSQYYGSPVTLFIKESQIFDNYAGQVGGGIYTKGTCNISDNLLLDNWSNDFPALYVTESTGVIYRNTIQNNSSINNPTSSAIYISGQPGFNNNNIFTDNTSYELYNNNPQGSANLNAQNNWWGTASGTEIQQKIYDWFDDSDKGIVAFSPYLIAPDTSAPPSPPTGLAATPGWHIINLSWDANPEADIAGYKLYYDTDSGFPYQGSGVDQGTSPIDVGNLTSFTLTGLTTDCVIAVTSYDTAGNESWYSAEKTAVLGGSISGYVFEEDGVTPVPGAEIKAYQHMFDEAGSAVTGENGYYQITGLPEGKYKLRVSADGLAEEWYRDAFGIWSCTPVNVSQSGDTTEVNFTLAPGSTISGHVYQQGTTTGIEYSRIMIMNETDMDFSWVPVAADGSYTTNGLEAGRYRLWALAPGNIGEWYNETGNYNNAEMFTVTVPGNYNDIDFTLEPGGAISGKVTGPDGQPADDDTILVVFGNEGQPYGLAWPGPDGNYTTTGLLSGDYALLSFSGDYAPEYYDNVYDRLEVTWITVTGTDITPGIDFEMDYPEGSIINYPRNAFPGECFIASLDINSLFSISTANYSLGYDPEVLQLEDITAGSMTFLDSQYDVQVPVNDWYVTTPGMVCIYQNIPGTFIERGPGSGRLVSLHFRVIGSVGDRSEITPQEPRIFNSYGEIIPVHWNAHGIQVTALPGDIDRNGMINVLDMTKAARIILEMDNPVYEADVNQDGNINVLDITKIARVILERDKPVVPPAVQWIQTYGDVAWDYAWDVQPTADGGFIMTGFTEPPGTGEIKAFLIKTDASGTITWSKNYEVIKYGFAVQQTADGGYVIAGWTDTVETGRDMALLKTDSSGNIEWSNNYGGQAVDMARDVRQTGDGGYIICGLTDSFGTGSTDVYLVKTDASGNELWSKTFGGSDIDYGFSLDLTDDGGYILSGCTCSFGHGDRDFYLVKTDAAGNMLWSNTFGGSEWEHAWSVRQTSDGGYIITGSTSSFGSGSEDVYLVKTDSAGNSVWEKTFGGTGIDLGTDVLQTPDGGYIISGLTCSSGDGSSDIYVIKTDSIGSKEWVKTTGGRKVEESRSICLTADGGYVIAGLTFSYGAGAPDMYLVKMK
ncbi:MAG: carboxypeptidase regulatory-like domain-containing protein [Dehalococcoidales bacterium]|nr:carboxypeptidase regulatory-like domain-containing protein [Dehalococcoidales bacterium]